MPAERFSVIIPSWNGAHLLPTCLASLRRQEYRDFETVVVDNASSDWTVELLRRDYPEVRVLPLPSNRGFAGAVNIGIAESSGELVALLNQDVDADSRWLAEMAAAAEAYPQAGSIACKIMLFDRRECFHSAGDSYRFDGIAVNRGVWQRDTGQYDVPQEVFGACGGAAAYRRSVLREVGSFDDGFFMYCEDVDLAWRQQLAGWRTIYAPRAVAFHRLSASGGGVTASYYTGRNTIYVIAKNVPAALLRRHLRAMIAAQHTIARDAVRSFRGSAARARLRGQLVGLLTWPRMLARRRIIQRSRRVSIAYLEHLLHAVD